MQNLQSQHTELTAGCGHTTIVRLSLDPQRAATEIAQLVSGECGNCARTARQSTRNILWADVNRSR
jgi:hypothetical protein